MVKYQYDSSNRRSSLEYGPVATNTVRVNYGFDGLSRPVTVTNWVSPTQTVGYRYSGNKLDSISYPNGITATYALDGANRLKEIAQLSGSSPVYTASYFLDGAGNRTAASENLNGVSRNLGYQYDELSRLTRESSQVGSSASVTSTYLYDQVGNRSRLTTTLPSNIKAGLSPLVLTTTYSYNQADQMTSRTETGSATPFNGYAYNYSFDANGSLITETNPVSGGEITSYSHDARNRLVGWQKQAKGISLATASFSYDGNNTRTSLTYGGRSTSYLQDTAGGLPVVLQETASTGSVTSFLYALGSTTPLYQSEAGGAARWQHADGVKQRKKEVIKRRES